MATHSCSCLENPRDGGAWWAAFCGVAQSRTRLKRLSSSSRSDAILVFWPRPYRAGTFYFLSQTFTLEEVQAACGQVHVEQNWACPQPQLTARINLLTWRVPSSPLSGVSLTGAEMILLADFGPDCLFRCWFYLQQSEATDGFKHGSQMIQLTF